MRLTLVILFAMVVTTGSMNMNAEEKKPMPRKTPSVREAQAFVEAAEARLLDLQNEAGQAEWVKSTYITEDTETLAARANARSIQAAVDYAKQASRFQRLKLPPDVARKMNLLKLAIDLPAPSNDQDRAELTRIAAAMDGAYGRGKYCPPGSEKCLDINDIERVVATSRDP